MRYLVPALLMLAIASDPATAIVVRHDVELADTEGAARRFPATARFVPDGCGTLIASDWVLTAAHVAWGLSPFGHEVIVDGRVRHVATVVFHPDSDAMPGYSPPFDAALVRLDAPILDVDPAPPYERRDEVGRVAWLVGYGDYGRAEADSLLPQNGVRRAVTNRIEAVAFENYLALALDRGPSGTRLEGASGPGDSGGPLYLETDDGIRTAGISAFTQGGTTRYESVDHFLRVSEIVDWIRETIEPTPAPSPLRVFDLTQDPPPRTTTFTVALRFVDRFNEGPASFAAFADTQADSSPWRELGKRFSLYGSLTPLRYVAVDDDRFSLLVSLGSLGGYRVINFRMDDAGTRIRDVKLGVVNLEPDSME